MKKGKIEQEFISEFTSKNSPKISQKIKTVTIGIAGCGGLGSNAAIALARTGIMNFVIVDYDKVEVSNLNRQQYSLNDVDKFKVDSLERILKSINPYIEIEKHRIKLNGINVYKVFEKCKIILEAFDTVSSKTMIIKAFANEKFKDRYLIAGSGVAGFDSANKIKTRKISQNIFVCGDNKTEPLESNGLMAPRVMITAGHQANAALRIIAKLED